MKAEKFVLKNPKISMICIENSFKMIDLLKDSSKNKIFSKFLLCCPKPFKKRLEINESKLIDHSELDLVKFFFVMILINKYKISNLNFNQESLNILSTHCGIYNNFCIQYEIDKPFLGYYLLFYLFIFYFK